MADKRHIIRQWLETDAAFGVTDVPLRLARRASAAKVIASPAASTPMAARVAASPAPAPQLAKPPPARPHAAPPSASPPPGPALIPNAVRAAAAGKKSAAAIPPIPTDLITALPPMTRRQKIAALAALLAEIETASQPFLNEISTRVVFGEGDPDAEILFIGEGPGIEEDRSGRPFVGRSGQLLDKMIAAIGYQRDAGGGGGGGFEGTGGVFIANVVKLRAAEFAPAMGRLVDRPPNPDEVARGILFLHRQIEIIRPRVIVTLGAPALKYMTGSTEGVMKIRGSWLSYRGIPLMPTYHPAFVLRNYTVESRTKVWNDLKLAQQRAKAT